MTTRIVIADSSPDHLRLLEIMFERSAEVDVVATATDGAKALRLVAVENVDVALLEVDMPGLDGFAAAEAIQQLRRERR